MIYTHGTWKSVHMWNQGKNCMGRRAFRKSNKSMQLGLKHHGTHYVEVLFLDPWQCTFVLPNFPNPHQDACAQLCLKNICQIFQIPIRTRLHTHESQICLNNNLKECFWWLSRRNLIRNGRLRDSNVAKWMYSCKSHPRSLPCGTAIFFPLICSSEQTATTSSCHRPAGNQSSASWFY